MFWIVSVVLEQHQPNRSVINNSIDERISEATPVSVLVRTTSLTLNEILFGWLVGLLFLPNCGFSLCFAVFFVFCVFCVSRITILQKMS